MNYQESTAYSVCFDTRSSPAGISFDRHALPALGSQELGEGVVGDFNSCLQDYAHGACDSRIWLGFV